MQRPEQARSVHHADGRPHAPVARQICERATRAPGNGFELQRASMSGH
jgi:hypothetical protein